MKFAIICVDDDPLVLDSLGEQLGRSLGREHVELAANASEALDLFAELQADGVEIPAIVSDRQMPGMSGEELLAQVHLKYPQTLTILLTGQSSVEQVAKAVNSANLYRYIAKPWDETDLLLTIDGAVKSYFQEREIVAQREDLSRANHHLIKSVSLLRATLESTADGILVVDNEGRVTHYNQKLSDLWELEREIAPSERERLILAAIGDRIQEPAGFASKVGQWYRLSSQKSSHVLTLTNGKIFGCYSQAQRLGGEHVGRVWSFRDLTEQRVAEETIHYQANYDYLTGLLNRTQIDEQLTELLTNDSCRPGSLAVLFVDLDRFKVINDTLGHVLGDSLLQQVVHRLQQCCLTGDLLARWGGDVFTMVLPSIADRDRVSALAQSILDSLHPSFQLEEHCVRISASIGIAIYPEAGRDAVNLLKNADTALSQAKAHGGDDYQYYTIGLSDRASTQLALENTLYQALEREEFSIQYQPQVNTATGEITHMEAILHWQHPQLGSIDPDLFIPIAERKGLLLRLGQWWLHQACAQAVAWQSMGLKPIIMALKLFPRQLWHRQLLETLDRTLVETGLQPQFLELEIPETAIVQDVDLARTILLSVRQIGVNIALDDFGTGYSSLRYLKQFPFQTLKIDRAFICELRSDLHSDPYYVAIVDALLTLGRRLNVRVVAKGVETIEIKNLLHTLQCHHMQGDWFNCPLSLEAATQVLLQNSQTFYLRSDLRNHN